MIRHRSPRHLALALVVALAAVASTTFAAVGAQTSVSTEAELRAAFAADDAVVMANDITLEDCTGGGALERPITDAVVLDGAGFTLTQTCADNVIVQETVGAEMLTVQNLTVTGGDAAGSGGGIFAQGDLTVLGSSLVGNSADGFGGGLATDGALLVDDTLIDGNSGGNGGGGIAGNVELIIVNSTVSNNSPGGGIATSGDTGADLVIVNSTVTGNGGVNDGGGVFSAGTTTIVYSTITNNTASDAFGNLFTQDTVIFGSVITGGAPNNCLGGGITSQGYNFSDDDSCNLTDPTDQQDAGDPGLGALADNGGPTPTQLPTSTSPLLGAIPTDACQTGEAAGITADQRGVTRPQLDGCDIGSVEVREEELVPLVPTTPVTPVQPLRTTPRFTG